MVVLLFIIPSLPRPMLLPFCPACDCLTSILFQHPPDSKVCKLVQGHMYWKTGKEGGRREGMWRTCRMHETRYVEVQAWWRPNFFSRENDSMTGLQLSNLCWTMTDGIQKSSQSIAAHTQPVKACLNQSHRANNHAWSKTVRNNHHRLWDCHQLICH